MSDLVGVSVRDLVQVLKHKQTRIPFEIGAFVALETCESLLPGPAEVRLDDVRVGEDGTVAVFAPPNSASGTEAAKSVVELLAHLLVAAGPGVPHVLLELVERGPSGGVWDLGRLRDELEASLVPLNRQAARRVLSRMLREADRATAAAPSAAAAPRTDDLVEVPGKRPSNGTAVDQALDALLHENEPKLDPDAELDALLGATHRPSGAPTTPRRQPPPAAEPPSVDEPSSVEEPSPVAPSPAPSVSAPVQTPAESEPEPLSPVAEPLPPPSASLRADVDLTGMREIEAEAKAKRRFWLVGGIFVVLAAGLVITVAMIRPDAVDRMAGRETPEARLAAELEEKRQREQQEVYAAHEAKFGELTVRVSPPQAQVLLFVGHGPAEAESLPQGIAHEFVAMVEGRRPERAVVPATASFGDEKRYELAIQIAEDAAESDGAMDLGSSSLPREMGTPTGTLGTVRVITNPPKAKVYMLIGFSPSVRVQNLRTDRPHELLLFHPDHPSQRVVVGPSDWKNEAGKRIAQLDIALPVETP